MDGTTTEGESRALNVRQAAFIGVGAMVGAGIFALLGAAGEVAGAAVWLSFLIAGAVAGLQGYSFAKFGARYPTVLPASRSMGFGVLPEQASGPLIVLRATIGSIVPVALPVSDTGPGTVESTTATLPVARLMATGPARWSCTGARRRRPWPTPDPRSSSPARATTRRPARPPGPRRWRRRGT